MPQQISSGQDAALETILVRIRIEQEEALKGKFA
uniref:Uncharacterized protein n=1 Tax=virus sp. ct5rm7 TaxID=2827298 RepID=A0A8S5RGY0_9VIRU|nr:MAG TPA: hypothetical protein [virus sp. ct5rm7]